MVGNNIDAKKIADKIIFYLQSKNKISLVADVSKHLSDYVYLHKKVVNVYSAQELDNNQKQKIISKFKKIINVDNFQFIIDEKLIAGILVKYKDKTWDLSLLNNLENIKTQP